jgi:hypothetical protein
MELVTCPNCFAVYGDAHARCPSCEADQRGEGGRVALDVTARAAVARLGGLWGGILEWDDQFLLWCARGVCLWSEGTGLVWERAVGARVDGVQLGETTVRVTRGERALEVSRVDGRVVR